jgi:hypothetical protein
MQEIYQSQIFDRSQCLQRERAMTDFIRQILQDHGYQSRDENPWILHKDQKRAIIAVVDDAEQANADGHEDFLSSLTANDIVITDNLITRPLLAQTIRLPDSWFGIYSHRPDAIIDLPDRAFTMPINRIDFNRTLLLLRMQLYGHLNHGYVNFNCSNHDGDQTHEEKQRLWRLNCDSITEWQGDKYQKCINSLSPKMPLRNHDQDHDVVCQSGGLNVVVETYSSDYSISFSEKIFRALVTPRPWTMLAGTWAVARLQRMGFDVMSDVIDHSRYDGLRMVDDKIAIFVDTCHRHWGQWPKDRLDHRSLMSYQRWYRRYVLPRAQRAAQTNQMLLEKFRRDWYRDFPRWITDLHNALGGN